MGNIIEVEKITKFFGDFTIKDISFSLPKGYIMGLIGANGAGKTSLIKMLMSLSQPDFGTIKLFGMEYTDQEIDIKSRIGFVYDNNHFYEDVSLQKMKNIIAPFYPTWQEEKYQYYSELFELSQKKKINKLSKGQQMKYSIALALSHDPELLIMDEPTAGLDPTFRRELLEILMELVATKEISILFSTHITSELDRVADYITFIQNGNMVFSKDKETILDTYRMVRGAKEVLTSELEPYFVSVRATNVGFEGMTKDIQAVQNLTNEKLTIEVPTLEEIMYYYKKGATSDASSFNR